MNPTEKKEALLLRKFNSRDFRQTIFKYYFRR